MTAVLLRKFVYEKPVVKTSVCTMPGVMIAVEDFVTSRAFYWWLPSAVTAVQSSCRDSCDSCSGHLLWPEEQRWSTVCKGSWSAFSTSCPGSTRKASVPLYSGFVALKISLKLKKTNLMEQYFQSLVWNRPINGCLGLNWATEVSWNVTEPPTRRHGYFKCPLNHRWALIHYFVFSLLSVTIVSQRSLVSLSVWIVSNE